MRFANLHDWLAWQEQLHPTEIELGLDRVATVLRRMNLDKPSFTIISVAGTNGKGSCVAMLDAIYRSAGYSVGAYTSPHLKKYNERITINGASVSDQELCEVFDEIDQSRGDISLTYFEFGTLAAIAMMVRANVDMAILEVGLGGRLDAVNVLDADVAVITSIGMDHQDWLGDSREKIALEKAGIARSGKPVVCGELNVPDSLIPFLQKINASLYLINRDFFVKKVTEEIEANRSTSTWEWGGQDKIHKNLPLPSLRGGVQLNNAATALQTIELLSIKHPVTYSDICDGLSNVFVAGRFQMIPGDVTLIVDVAHNTQAAQALAVSLKALTCKGSTFAVFGCFNDKDLPGIVVEMCPLVDSWYVATLDGPRAQSAEEISRCIKVHCPDTQVTTCKSINLAKDSAIANAKLGDRIVMFGSFYVASEVL